MGIEQKAASTIEGFQRTTRQGGCGCFVTGCGISLVVLLLMCVGSYFVTMHSSLPLSWIEKAIESDGNVEIEGLRGTISSGFEIDSLRFEAEPGDPWSELRHVRFSFNGFVNLARTGRLIIEEASVGGATIYTEFGEDDELTFQGDIDGEEVASEFAEEFDEIRDELENDGDFDELKELRVDLVSAKNVELIDPDTNTRIEFQKIEFRDFQMLRGRVTRLGDLIVVSDQLDLTSRKSERYSSEDVAWNLTGVVKPSIHKRMIKGIPFDVDFAFFGKNECRLHMNLINGQVDIDEPFGDLRVVKLADFSHGEYFDMESGLVPSNWNLEVSVRREKPDQATIDNAEQDNAESDSKDVADTRDNKADRETGKKGGDTFYRVTVAEGGSFQLGTTTFEIEPSEVLYLGNNKAEPAVIMAKGIRNDVPITARLQLQGDLPYFTIQLSSSDRDSRDLWSGLFFDNDYGELDAIQKQEVDNAVSPPLLQDELEPVDF